MNRENLFKYLSHIVLLIQCLILGPTVYGYLKGLIAVNLVILILIFLVAVSMLYCMYITYGTPRVYIAHSEEDSIRSIKQIYKRVYNFLGKNKLIQLYEANLETRNPGKNILEDDIKMATWNSGATVRWKMVILKTPNKEHWVEEWKSNVWKKNEDCRLYIVCSESPLNDYQLLNFMTIPDIGETYIGYGHYPGFQGGGIRIRNRRISMEIKGVIDNWSKIGQEQMRTV